MGNFSLIKIEDCGPGVIEAVGKQGRRGTFQSLFHNSKSEIEERKMEYVAGRIGRVFVVRLRDGDEIYPCLEGLAGKEGIQSAVVLCIGGVRSGKMVTGPKEALGKIEPMFSEFNDARELAGVGTIFWDGGKPSLHLHAAVGRGEETLVGCPRGGAVVFLIQEAVMIELLGIEAKRLEDPESGLKLLKLLGDVKRI